MERQEILNKIIQIFKENNYYVSDEIITEETKINDFGLDDIDCVEIEIKLETKFNLPNLSCDEIILKSETFKDLIDKISDILN